MISIICNPPLSYELIIKFLLTLSGLPFHIHLKHFFSKSLWYISGTKHTLANNVNRGKINDLIIKSFPDIERFLFPHAQHSLFILSILFSQFSFWHSSLLLPKYIPSYLMAYLSNWFQQFCIYNFLAYQSTPPLCCFYLTINMNMSHIFLVRSLPLRHLLYYCKIGLYHRLVVKF